jgi:hypothetical protein
LFKNPYTADCVATEAQTKPPCPCAAMSGGLPPFKFNQSVLSSSDSEVVLGGWHGGGAAGGGGAGGVFGGGAGGGAGGVFGGGAADGGGDRGAAGGGAGGVALAVAAPAGAPAGALVVAGGGGILVGGGAAAGGAAPPPRGFGGYVLEADGGNVAPVVLYGPRPERIGLRHRQLFVDQIVYHMAVMEQSFVDHNDVFGMMANAVNADGGERFNINDLAHNEETQLFKLAPGDNLTRVRCMCMRCLCFSVVLLQSR